jgi:hypothetical protein
MDRSSGISENQKRQESIVAGEPTLLTVSIDVLRDSGREAHGTSTFHSYVATRMARMAHPVAISTPFQHHRDQVRT